MSTKGIKKKNNPEYEERTGSQGQIYYKKREEVQKATDIDHNEVKQASNDFEDPTEEDAEAAQLAYETTYETTYNAAKEALQEFEYDRHDRIAVTLPKPIYVNNVEEAAHEYADAYADSGEKYPITITLKYEIGNDIVDEANGRAFEKFCFDELPENASVDTLRGILVLKFDSLEQIQEKQETANKVATAVKAIWDDTSSPVLSLKSSPRLKSGGTLG